MTNGSVTKWWWIRHAPVVDAHLMRLSGQSDVDADLSDTQSFAALAPRLPAGAEWLTSNLVRTHQTAQGLWQAGAEHGETQIEPAFAEQAFGDWSGCTWEELADLPEGKAFWDAPATFAPPSSHGGASECFADVCARVTARIDELNVEFAGRDLICVAHAGPIRAAVAYALGVSPERALAIDVGNVSLTRLDHFSDGPQTNRDSTKYSGDWRVVGVNQIC